jgi:nicotinate-nucleotide--dimethylbenzimidazole phosphoribosyltransferase
MSEDSLGYIIASHEGSEPAVKHLLKALGLKPAVKASMRLGEGTGAVALFPLLDMALAVMNSAARLNEL